MSARLKGRSAFLDAAKSFLRTWIVSTLMLWIPGLLGWVHEVSDWAAQKGAPPFPDPSNLAFLFVAALTGAFPAVGMAVLRILENSTGATLLPRPSGPQPPYVAPPQGGAVSLALIGLVVALAGLLVLLLTTVNVLGWLLLIVGVVLAAYALITTRSTG